jgi:hypothetical protein
MGNFENRLLAALTEIDAQRPATTPTTARGRWVRPSLVGAAAVAAALAGAVVVGGMTGPRPPAHTGTAGSGSVAAPPVRNVGFSLLLNSDGSVDFTATGLVDPAAATAALNAAGIAGRVVVQRDACAPVDWNDVAVRPRPRQSSRSDRRIPGNETVTLRSSDYPRGGGLLVVIMVRNYPEGTVASASWLGYRDLNRIPRCVQFHDPDAG